MPKGSSLQATISQSIQILSHTAGIYCLRVRAYAFSLGRRWHGSAVSDVGKSSVLPFHHTRSFGPPSPRERALEIAALGRGLWGMEKGRRFGQCHLVKGVILSGLCA